MKITGKFGRELTITAQTVEIHLPSGAKAIIEHRELAELRAGPMQLFTDRGMHVLGGAEMLLYNQGDRMAGRLEPGISPNFGPLVLPARDLAKHEPKAQMGKPSAATTPNSTRSPSSSTSKPIPRLADHAALGSPGFQRQMSNGLTTNRCCSGVQLRPRKSKNFRNRCYKRATSDCYRGVGDRFLKL